MPGRGFPLGNPFGGGGAGNPQMAPQLDMGFVQKLLGQYGIQLPGQLSDAGPFQQAQEGQDSDTSQSVAGHLLAGHPAIARGLDNALISAALTKQGRTVGENISNVAQGVLGVAPYRREMQAQQLQAPLEFAKELGGLQAQQAMMQMYSGMGDYYRARGTAATLTPEERMNSALMRTQMQGALKPRIGVENGQEVVQTAQIDPQDYSIKWQTDPSLSVADLRRQEHSAAHGIAYDTYAGMTGAEPDPSKDPVGNQKWWTGFHKQQMQDAQTKQAYPINLRNTEPPSAQQEWEKRMGGYDKEFGTATYPKFNSTQWIANRKAQLIGTQQAPGPMYNNRVGASAQAKIDAQGEEQRQQLVNSQLSEYTTQFKAMSPDQQQAYGSLNGYLMKEHGWDAGTKTFAQKPSPQGQQNIQQGVMPSPQMPQQPRPSGPAGPAAPSPMNMGGVAGMDPAVQAIIQSLSNK